MIMQLVPCHVPLARPLPGQGAVCSPPVVAVQVKARASKAQPKIKQVNRLFCQAPCLVLIAAQQH